MADRVFGLFSDRAAADSAINDLYDAGFKKEDVSVVMREDMKETRVTGDNQTGSNVASGAASGATTGAVIGGIAGLLIGIGAVTIPGIGALLIGGPIAAALGLTGAAATTATGAITGALAGGLVGALVGLGVPEEEARVYEAGVKEGGVMISVNTDTASRDNARRIMEDNGAKQVTVVS